ncbi:hypothetical protein J6590_023746 [Homalodisca vitripennis]|nr:hypothetical protein J6590_023746 [Homalodisca vitripennis]
MSITINIAITIISSSSRRDTSATSYSWNPITQFINKFTNGSQDDHGKQIAPLVKFSPHRTYYWKLEARYKSDVKATSARYFLRSLSPILVVSGRKYRRAAPPSHDSSLPAVLAVVACGHDFTHQINRAHARLMLSNRKTSPGYRTRMILHRKCSLVQHVFI